MSKINDASKAISKSVAQRAALPQAFPALYAEMKDGKIAVIDASKYDSEMNDWLKQNGKFDSITFMDGEGTKRQMPFNEYGADWESFIRSNVSMGNPKPARLKQQRMAQVRAENTAAKKQNVGTVRQFGRELDASLSGTGAEMLQVFSDTAKTVVPYLIQAGAAGVPGGMGGVHAPLKTNNPIEMMAESKRIARKVNEGIKNNIDVKLEAIPRTPGQKFVGRGIGEVVEILALGGMKTAKAGDATVKYLTKRGVGELAASAIGIGGAGAAEGALIAAGQGMPAEKIAEYALGGGIGGAALGPLLKTVGAAATVSRLRKSGEFIPDTGADQMGEGIADASKSMWKALRETTEAPGVTYRQPFKVVEETVEASRPANEHFAALNKSIDTNRANIETIRAGHAAEIEKFTNDVVTPAKKNAEDARNLYHDAVEVADTQGGKNVDVVSAHENMIASRKRADYLETTRDRMARLADAREGDALGAVDDLITRRDLVAKKLAATQKEAEAFAAEQMRGKLSQDDELKKRMGLLFDDEAPAVVETPAPSAAATTPTPKDNDLIIGEAIQAEQAAKAELDSANAAYESALDSHYGADSDLVDETGLNAQMKPLEADRKAAETRYVAARKARIDAEAVQTTPDASAQTANTAEATTTSKATETAGEVKTRVKPAPLDIETSVPPSPAKPDPIQLESPESPTALTPEQVELFGSGAQIDYKSTRVRGGMVWARQTFGTKQESLGPTLQSSMQMYTPIRMAEMKLAIIKDAEIKAVNKVTKGMTAASRDKVKKMAESFILVDKGVGEISSRGILDKDIRFGARNRTGDTDWRYNPKESRDMWNAASDAEKKAAVFTREKFDTWKPESLDPAVVDGNDIEAYVYQMYEKAKSKSIRNIGKQVLSDKPTPNYLKQRTGKGAGEEITDIKRILLSYIDEKTNYEVSMATAAEIEKELARGTSKEMAELINNPAGIDNLQTPTGWEIHKVQFVSKEHPLNGVNILVPSSTKRYMDDILIKNGGDADVSEFKLLAMDTGRWASAFWKATMLGFNVKTPTNNIIGGAYQLSKAMSERILDDVFDIVAPGRQGSRAVSSKAALDDMLNMFCAVPRSVLTTTGEILKEINNLIPYANRDAVTAILENAMKNELPEAAIGKRLADELKETGLKNRVLTLYMNAATYMQRHSENIIARSSLYIMDGSNVKKSIDIMMNGEAMGLSKDTIRANNERLMTAVIESDRIRYLYDNNPKMLDGLVKKAIPFVNFIYHSLRLETGAIPIPGTIKSLATAKDVESFSKLFREAINKSEADDAMFNNAAAYGLYNKLKNRGAADLSKAPRTLTKAEQSFMAEFQRRAIRENLSKLISASVGLTAIAKLYDMRKQADPTNTWYTPQSISYEVKVDPSRMYVGSKGGKAGYMKVSQFSPWFWLESKGVQALAYGIQGKTTKDVLPEYQTFLQESISYSPVVDAAFTLVGVGNEYDVAKTKGARLGKTLSGYTPGGRTLAPIARYVEYKNQTPEYQEFGAVDYKRDEFFQALVQNVPFLSDHFHGEQKEYPGGMPRLKPKFDWDRWRTELFFNVKWIDEKKKKEIQDVAAPKYIGKQFKNYLDENFKDAKDIPALNMYANPVEDHFAAVTQGINVPEEFKLKVYVEMRKQIDIRRNELSGALPKLKDNNRGVQ